MSIEQTLERIAVALETIATKLEGADPLKEVRTAVVTEVKKIRRMKDAAIPAQQEAAQDSVPGVEDAPTGPSNAVEPGDATVANGEELRNLAQSFIQAADQSDPGGKKGSVNKLVTFIQSVAKIFNPAEPKLKKIPDAKVPEAAKMIADWCDKNGIKLPIEV